MQFVKVFLAQQYGTLAKSQEEVLGLLYLVELAQFLDNRCCQFYLVLLKPLLQGVLSFLL